MTCTGVAWMIGGTTLVAFTLPGLAMARAAEQADSRPTPTVSRATAPPLPDLIVRLTGPATARPGEAIGERVRLIVANGGGAPAWGTREHPTGYMVDLTLGRDTVLSVGFKAYSPHFAEDVLLEGGRVSRTSDLAPAATRRCAVAAVIPADVPVGPYHLCAFVDPGNVVVESDERNNAACVPLRIVPPAPDGEAPTGAVRPGAGETPPEAP